MTPEYVLRKSLCREAHCGYYVPDNATEEQRTKAREADIRSAISEIEDMNYASEYGEPGYSQPSKGILFANWNYFPCKATDLLEQMGYEIQWSYEWTTCEGCGKALRTSPDCYQWQPSYFIENECSFVCRDCLDIPAYLESMENNPRRALNDHINPADYGYELVEDKFESGWYPGQNDDPHKIFEKYSEKYSRLLFCVDSVGQFDVRFSIWYFPENGNQEEE